jgi:hypothetical protein
MEAMRGRALRIMGALYDDLGSRIEWISDQSAIWDRLIDIQQSTIDN